MCKHFNMKPYYYGYLTDSLMQDIHNGMVWYGGNRKTEELPDYFCPDCLEDIFELI